MPRRLTNLLLLGLTLGLAGSGLAGWIAPDAQAAPWYALHRALGAGLLLTLLWKVPIARGSLGRRLARTGLRRTTVPGLLTAVVVLTVLGLGLAWTTGLLDLSSFGGYSPLNVHVLLGLLVLPLLGWHLARRWERRPPLPALARRRRTLVSLGGLLVGTLAGWRLLDALAAGVAVPGARRPSGSRHVGSFSGNAYPETIWQFDRVPSIAPETWALEIVDRGRPLGRLSLDALAALPERSQDAVLDCTSGWWSEQRWSGWRLGDVLALAAPELSSGGGAGGEVPAGLAEVVSVTGHRWTFPLPELATMLLVTHVGDEPLTPGHGGPVRLVAPGRRGFQWVKWVARVEILA